MSSIYNLEPQPTASLILHTTLGDLSVELFAKQTPLTSRNFLQLCLDGYYDNTIFHRLVPGFIIQGGDPTGTGNGGESIYDGGAYSGDLDPWPMDQRRGKNAGPMGVNFKDESHSRLKFNRRGLLGMANESKPDTNGSQFFFTFDKAPELDGKNTMFGRIVGDTIYNLARMGEAELAEGSERPLYPIKITGVEILVNPFEDMKKRERVAARSQQQQVPTSKPQQKKKKPKAGGGKKLLSFGDEEGGDDDAAPVIKKAKFDTRIVMEEDEETAAPTSKAPKSSAAKKEQEKSVKKSSIPAHEPAAVAETKLQTTRRPPSPPPPQAKEVPKPVYEDLLPEREEPERPKKSALERANEEIAQLKASMKRTVYEDDGPVKEVKKTALEQLIPESSTRGRKRRRDGEGAMSSADYSMFEAFRSKLVESASKAPPPSSNHTSAKPRRKVANGTEKGEENSQQDTTATGAEVADDDDEAELCDLHFIANCQSCRSWAAAADTEGEQKEKGDDANNEDEDEDDDDDDGSWITHRLSFAADKLGKDLTYRKKAEEELIVIDPREKARTLKEEQKARRGDAGREWDQTRDQARNAKLARASALAGRGAR